MHEKQEQPDLQLRELCRRAAQEKDTNRLMELVKEIIATYDAQRERIPNKSSIEPESRT
jgi:hypothetical protein